MLNKLGVWYQKGDCRFAFIVLMVAITGIVSGLTVAGIEVARLL